MKLRAKRQLLLLLVGFFLLISLGASAAWAGDAQEGPLPGLPPGTYLTLDSSQEGPPLRVQAGEEFKLYLKVWDVVDLASFQGNICFDQDQVDFTVASVGEFVYDWQLFVEPTVSGQVYITSCLPAGEAGKTGSGVLLVLNFRAKEDGGGRAVFSLGGGTFVPESEEPQAPFHWSGYLTNINGEDIPVKGLVPPNLGISNYIEITPLQNRITASNSHYQTVRLNFSQAMQMKTLNRITNYEISTDGGNSFTRLSRVGGSAVVADPFVALLIVGDGVGFSPGDALQLRLSGLKTQEGAFLSPEPYLTPVFTACEGPADDFSITEAYLSYQGDRNWPAYDAAHPPTLDAKTNDFSPMLKWVKIYNAEGQLIKEIRFSPGQQLPQEIPLEPDWPAGNYTLELYMTSDFDYSGTIVARYALPLVVGEVVNEVHVELSRGRWGYVHEDEVVNKPITWQEKWFMNIVNTPDGTGHPVLSPKIVLQTDKRLVGFGRPEALAAEPEAGRYTWDFRDLSLPENSHLPIGCWEENSWIEEKPHFSVTRHVYPVEVAEAITQQEVIVNFTLEEPLLAGEGVKEISVSIGEPEIAGEKPPWRERRVLEADPCAGWRQEVDLDNVVSWTANIDEIGIGKTYTFRALLELVWGEERPFSYKPGIRVGYALWQPQEPVRGTEISLQHPDGPYALFQVAEPVLWHPGISYSRYDFWITPQACGSISGVVYDEQGNPLAGISVDCGRIDGPGGGGAQTREDGTYTIDGLPFGTYKVAAPADGRWGPNDGNWAREWYNDKPNWDQADLVTITKEQPEATGIDFALAQGGSISGTVYDENGNPLANADVWADYWDGGWAGGTRTDENGNYIIQGLASGEYRVGAYIEGRVKKWYNNTFLDHEATPVNVLAGQDTPDIGFTLELAGSISGRVIDQNTGEPPQESIELAEGWHKIVYRQEEMEGFQASRAAFKAPGDTEWRWFSTSGLGIRTSPDHNAAEGILLTTKKNNWDWHPQNHSELVGCVDQDATEEAGWYGQNIVSIINQDRNIHGNSDYYTSYYEAYFYVDKPGKWYFSTDSDDASEIVIDDQVVASWYGGHGPADRWGYKCWVRAETYNWEDDNQWFYGDALIEPDGTYKIKGVPSGKYRVWVDAPGYVVEYYNNTWNWEEATPVVVNAPADTPGINFALERGGSISGRVVDEQGKPIVGANVVAWSEEVLARIRARTGLLRIVGANVVAWSEEGGGGWARTDSDGNYTIDELPGDEYLVWACAPGKIREYYNGTYDWDKATLVKVTPPENIPGINFVLEQGGRILGKITDEKGNPIAGVFVIALSYENGVTVEWVSGAESDQQGNYIIGENPWVGTLRSGEYKVLAMPPNHDPDWNRIKKWYLEGEPGGVLFAEEASLIKITTPQDATGIDIALDEIGGSISGTVFDHQGNPLADVWLRADYYDHPYHGAGLAGTDENGNYIIRGLPTQRYRVGIEWTDGWYSHLWYDGTYLYEEAVPVAVYTPEQTAGINFVLQPAGAIEGSIRLQGRPKSGGKVLEEVKIALLNNEGKLIYSADIRSQRGFGTGGEFFLDGLPAGTYTLVVSHPGHLRAGRKVEVKVGEIVDAGELLLLAGDISGNNIVDLMDLVILARVYATEKGKPRFDERADFNADGVIDIDDLLFLRLNYDKEGYGGRVMKQAINYFPH